MTNATTPATDNGRGHTDNASVRLVVSPGMQLEQMDQASATIYLESNGTRIRIARALYNLLLMFEEPRTVLSVAGTDGHSARVVKAISELQAKGFLIAEYDSESSPPPRPTTDPPVRMFDCPAQRLAPAQADIAIVGVPYDLSDRWAAGARDGPAAIRGTSLQMLYGIDRRTGRSRGWYDVDRARPILEGVSIADCGDIRVDYGETQSQLFKRLSEVMNTVTSDGAMPVLLGGDASISLPTIRMLQAGAPLAVIRFDCCAREASETVGLSSFATPHTLPRLVTQLPGVTRYVQVGGRGAGTDVPEGASPASGRVGVAELRRFGFPAIERALHDTRRLYLGLDMNALETGSACGHSNCERFTYAEMHALLCGIGTSYTIAGVDFVGLNPWKSDWRVASITALHLLLTALSAAKDEK